MSVVLPPGFVVCTGEAFKWFVVIGYHILSYNINSVRIRTLGKNWGKMFHARAGFSTCWYCIIVSSKRMNSFDFKVSHRTWTLWFSLGIDIWGIHVVYSRNHSGIGGLLHQCRKFFCCKQEVPFLLDFLPLKKVNWKRSRKVGDQGRMAKFILILGDKSGRLLPLPSSVFYFLNSRSSTSFCDGNRPSPFFLGQLSK